MPFNGSGTFTRVYNWATDAAGNIPITASRVDTEDTGFATGLSSVICKDGQTTCTAQIPFAAGIKTWDGTVSSPAIAFTAELGSGFYRAGAGEIGFAVTGTQVVDYKTGTVTISPNTASSSSTTGALVVTGGVGVGGAANVAGAISCGISGSATGGQVKYTDDGGTSRWINGITGTAGGKNYMIFDVVNNVARMTVDYSTGQSAFPANIASSSTTTGTVAITGGLGVTGAVNIGGAFSSTAGVASSLTCSVGTNWVCSFTNSFVSAGAKGIYVAAGSNDLTDGATIMVDFLRPDSTALGSITRNLGAIAYNTTSDARLKEDPQSFDGASVIDSLRVYYFKWKNADSRAHGVFAQEAYEVYPEAVNKPTDDRPWEVDYSKFVPVLIRALQQANARIAALEAKCF